MTNMAYLTPTSSFSFNHHGIRGRTRGTDAVVHGYDGEKLSTGLQQTNLDFSFAFYSVLSHRRGVPGGHLLGAGAQNCGSLPSVVVFS
jgi:hypothetical protein